ncbi:MAG: hypothetical protein ACHQ1F_11870, partial [Spirochaetia bacterium]
MMKSEREVAEGFVEKVDRWEESKDWADVIVFDDCEFGPLADKLRAEGKAVIGGTPYTDRLEMDREFGQVLADAGARSATVMRLSDVKALLDRHLAGRPT